MSKRLLQAVLSKDLNDVIKYVKKGDDINFKDSDGKTPLITAAENNYTEIVEFLTSQGANINIKDNNGNTVLMKASMWNDRNGVIDIILRRATISELNVQGQKGKTALMLAAQNGNMILMKKLIDKKANLETKDEDGNTAFIYAIRSRNSTAVSFLIENGANIYTKDNNNSNVLIATIDADPDNTELMKVFLKKGLDPYEKDLNGLNAFDYAPQNSFAYILLQEIKEKEGEKIFVKYLTAIKNKDTNEIQKLLNKNKDANLRDEEGVSLLMHAVSVKNNLALIKILIENGANVNMVDNSDKTVLMYAVMVENNVEVVKYIVSKGAKVDYSNKKGKTAFDLAFDDSLKWLNISYGHLNKNRDKQNVQNANQVNNNGGFQPTVNNGHQPIAENKPLSETDKQKLTEKLFSELLKGSKFDSIETISLIKKGADVNKKDADGMTPLMYSVGIKNNINIVKSLIEFGANVNEVDEKGKSVLMFAVMTTDNGEVIKYLIANKASVSYKTPKGKSIEDYSTEENKIYIQNANQVSNNGGFQPTVNNGHQPIAENKPLSEADKQKLTEKLFSELLKGSKFDSIEVISLIKKGADINKKDADGMTPLMYSVGIKNNINVVKTLVEFGANVNEVDEKGKSVLMLAVMTTDNGEVIKYLIANKASVSYKTPKGKSIEDYSTEENKIYIQNANQNVQNANQVSNNGGFQPTIKNNQDNGHQPIAENKPLSEADKQKLTEKLFSELLKGSKFDSIETISLIKKGADVNKKDAEGMTSLMYAVEIKNNLNVVKTLIEFGANVNEVDEKGKSVLMHAVMTADNGEVIKYLIANKASVSYKTSKGKSIFDYSTEENKKHL